MITFDSCQDAHRFADMCKRCGYQTSVYPAIKPHSGGIVWQAFYWRAHEAVAAIDALPRGVTTDDPFGALAS
jgi:hypothetical protein